MTGGDYLVIDHQARSTDDAKIHDLNNIFNLYYDSIYPQFGHSIPDIFIYFGASGI